MDPTGSQFNTRIQAKQTIKANARPLGSPADRGKNPASWKLVSVWGERCGEGQRLRRKFPSGIFPFPYGSHRAYTNGLYPTPLITILTAPV
jgi:hypothetical protein